MIEEHCDIDGCNNPVMHSLVIPKNVIFENRGYEITIYINKYFCDEHKIEFLINMRINKNNNE